MSQFWEQNFWKKLKNKNYDKIWRQTFENKIEKEEKNQLVYRQQRREAGRAWCGRGSGSPFRGRSALK